MDSQSTQPAKSLSKIGQIEGRVDHLLGSSARIKDISAKMSDRLIGSLPKELPDKEAKEPTGKLESIISHLDTVDARLSAAENDLKLIDKETE